MDPGWISKGQRTEIEPREYGQRMGRRWEMANLKWNLVSPDLEAGPCICDKSHPGAA